jgi:hypothetical protein
MSPSPNKTSKKTVINSFGEGELFLRGASAPLRKLLPFYERGNFTEKAVGFSRL